MAQKVFYFKSWKIIYTFDILISFYMISVSSAEMCETLCLSDEQCVKNCINSVKSQTNKELNNRLEREKIQFFSSNQRERRESPHCGLQKNEKKIASYTTINAREGNGRVVGGADAQMFEFPWIVSLQRKDWRGFWKHYCAGSIINDYHIITAAHCTHTYVGKEKELMLRLGINNCLDPTEGVFMSVIKAIVHSKWNRKANLNDISLLRTTRPIKYTIDAQTGNYSINSICLPKAKEEPTGSAVLAGWGQMGEYLPASEYLQKLQIPIFSRDQCRQNYKQYSDITSNMLCYGGQGEHDSCMGDSGGPLIQSNGDEFTIIGLVSFGIPCARKGFPGVYTQVSKYIDWIDKNANVL